MSGTTPDDESYQLVGLAGLYALDALEGEELARFEAHLATNPELQEEVAGYRATASRLAELPATPPPPGLRDRVLAEVATTRQESPIVRLDERRGRTAIGRAVLAAAAVVAVLAAGLGGFLLADRSSDDGTVQVASELSRVLAREDAVVVPLTGVGSDVAAGQVVLSKSSGTVVIVSDRMPPTAEGRTYELWKVDAAGAAHKAGLFEPGADGRVEAALDVGLHDAVAFAITDEPDGGSPQATTPVLMQASLA